MGSTRMENKRMRKLYKVWKKTRSDEEIAIEVIKVKKTKNS